MLAGVQEYCVTFFTQYFFTILFRVIAVTVIGDVTQHVFALAPRRGSHSYRLRVQLRA